MEVLAGISLEEGQAALGVDGDDLICDPQDAAIPGLSDVAALRVRARAEEVNSLPRGQLWGALLLVIHLRPEVMRSALADSGWSDGQRIEGEMLAAEALAAVEAERRREAIAVGGERRAAVNRAMREHGLMDDPAGALELLAGEEAERGAAAVEGDLGLPEGCLRLLLGRLRKLAAAEPEPAPVIEPEPEEEAEPAPEDGEVLSPAGPGPADEPEPEDGEVLQPQGRGPGSVPQCPECQAAAAAPEGQSHCVECGAVFTPVRHARYCSKPCRDRVAARAAHERRREARAAKVQELIERFRDEGRRRWLLRQMAEAEGDPVQQFAEGAGLTVREARAILRELQIGA